MHIKEKKPKDIIDEYLTSTYFSILAKDIGLNPFNYSFPTLPLVQDIYTVIDKSFRTEFIVYFGITEIDTIFDMNDLNIIISFNILFVDIGHNINEQIISGVIYNEEKIYKRPIGTIKKRK